MRLRLLLVSIILIAGVVAALFLAGRTERPADGIPPVAPVAAPPAPPETSDAESTREDCVAVVDKARALASALPNDHPARYIAERHLHQSLVEAGNGEFDDCLYWAARATEEVTELRHEPRAGESIEVLQPDQAPAKAEAPKRVEKKPARDKARK